MAYTTAEKVGELLEITDEFPVAPHIETAHWVVEENLTPLKKNGQPYYSEVGLELIERWLAAHFYAVAVPRAQQERAGSVGESFFGVTGLGYDVTLYGQQAMRIDSSGVLAKLNKGRRIVPSITHLG